MAALTCSKCGKTSATGSIRGCVEGTQCVSKAACKKRRDRKPQYDAASWKDPSFEQMMST